MKTKPKPRKPTVMPAENRLPVPTGPTALPLVRLVRSTDKERQARGCMGYPWIEVLVVKRWTNVHAKQGSFYTGLEYWCRVPDHVGGVDLQWFCEDDLFGDGGMEGEYDCVP